MTGLELVSTVFKASTLSLYTITLIPLKIFCVGREKVGPHVAVLKASLSSDLETICRAWDAHCLQNDDLLPCALSLVQ